MLGERRKGKHFHRMSCVKPPVRRTSDTLLRCWPRHRPMGCLKPGAVRSWAICTARTADRFPCVQSNLHPAVAIWACPMQCCRAQLLGWFPGSPFSLSSFGLQQFCPTRWWPDGPGHAPLWAARRQGGPPPLWSRGPSHLHDGPAHGGFLGGPKWPPSTVPCEVVWREEFFDHRATFNWHPFALSLCPRLRSLARCCLLCWARLSLTLERHFGGSGRGSGARE